MPAPTRDLLFQYYLWKSLSKPHHQLSFTSLFVFSFLTLDETCRRSRSWVCRPQSKDQRKDSKGHLPWTMENRFFLWKSLGLQYHLGIRFLGDSVFVQGMVICQQSNYIFRKIKEIPPPFLTLLCSKPGNKEVITPQARRLGSMTAHPTPLKIAAF